MNSTNHSNDRAIQQDARAWAKFTGCKYTTALRQMESPLAQGFLGERISARTLIATLKDHILVGGEGEDFVLGDEGFYADEEFSFNQKDDYVLLALVADTLRMFNPLETSATPEVDSYQLKHTVENFLGPTTGFSYVSTGRLIWAAAALGLSVTEPNRGSAPNLHIGIVEREHNYAHRMNGAGQNQPRGHHYRPPGYDHLQAALQRYVSGTPVGVRWVRPTPTSESNPFHEWLMLQVDREKPVGEFARDYAAGIWDSDHQIARTPAELMDILQVVGSSYDARRAAEETIAEWTRRTGSVGIRTKRLSSTSENVGVGDHAGNMQRTEFLCPCGEGKVIEEHDNIPGFRDHSHWIECAKCNAEWQFVSGRSVYEWRLEPRAERSEQSNAA